MWSALAIALGLVSKLLDLIPKKSAPSGTPTDKEILQAKALEKELEDLKAPNAVKPRPN